MYYNTNFLFLLPMLSLIVIYTNKTVTVYNIDEDEDCWILLLDAFPMTFFLLKKSLKFFQSASK
jgi:DNA polymerase II large subunit